MLMWNIEGGKMKLDTNKTCVDSFMAIYAVN